MEIGEISLLSIVTAVAPMALFVLLALFAPLAYRRIAGKLIENSVHISRSGSASFWIATCAQQRSCCAPCLFMLHCGFCRWN